MKAKILAAVIVALGGVALLVAIAAVFSWFVMLLWNGLMPDIFGLPPINFWQALGLQLLSHLLLAQSSSTSKK